MKLARLEPDRQTEVASRFASDSIKSVDEYLRQTEAEVPEPEDSTPIVAYDNFMAASSEVLHKIEDFCTSLEDTSPDLTPEQSKKVKARIGKLREAVDKLAAQFKNVR